MSELRTITINGESREIAVPPAESLLNLLRDYFDLTGCKISCGEGECGACTVLVDGQPARSCITPVSAVYGKQVQTVEGLERNGKLHPLQEAFLAADALQCGYCTPGMLMAGVGLLQQHPEPSQEEIVRFMQGNICRCGVYPRIIRAIQQAAAQMRAAAVEEVADAR